MKYGTAITRDTLLIYAARWMNLENMMLNERNLTQKRTDWVIPLMWNSRTGETNL